MDVLFPIEKSPLSIFLSTIIPKFLPFVPSLASLLCSLMIYLVLCSKFYDDIFGWDTQFAVLQEVCVSWNFFGARLKYYGTSRSKCATSWILLDNSALLVNNIEFIFSL